jgi:hypothetical protein
MADGSLLVHHSANFPSFDGKGQFFIQTVMYTMRVPFLTVFYLKP